MSYQEIQGYLHSLANPVIAEHSQCFFKTAEGEYDFGNKYPSHIGATDCNGYHCRCREQHDFWQGLPRRKWQRQPEPR